MNFHIRASLDYTLHDPASFFFALKCIETGGQKIQTESLIITPPLPVEEFSLDVGMNRFCRINTSEAGALSVIYESEISTAPQLIPISDLRSDGIATTAAESIPYLFPSRYCPSDQLRQEATDLFGHLSGQYETVCAIRDWIHQNVTYVSGSSDESSSALETFAQKQGVCRDFAHLAISFCRALNLPARYATCYSYQLQPQDFHACFEVFIGGWWLIFDATGLAPLNGLVRIATGRDAADTAVCTIFGNPELVSSVVLCECPDPDFTPVTWETQIEQNVAVAL